MTEMFQSTPFKTLGLDEKGRCRVTAIPAPNLEEAPITRAAENKPRKFHPAGAVRPS